MGVSDHPTDDGGHSGFCHAPLKAFIKKLFIYDHIWNLEGAREAVHRGVFVPVDMLPVDVLQSYLEAFFCYIPPPPPDDSGLTAPLLSCRGGFEPRGG